NNFSGVKITTLPGAGALTLDGVAVTAGQIVSAADIAAGKLVFTPAANASGAGYASFTFQVQDDDGIANGGADIDAIARAMSIDVLPVNDAPGESVPGAQRVTQGGSLVFSTSDANAISISDIDAGANHIQVTLASTGGWIKLASVRGLTFTAGSGQHDSLVTFS